VNQRLLWLTPLDAHRDLGLLLFRLFLGAVLVYGTVDNVVSGERMHEFRDFLAGHGFPAPLLSAHVSVYAQFVCGLLLAAGLLTRWAALVMIVNFSVAFAMVHVGLPFSVNISPMAMLFGSVLLLLHGAGPLSVDAQLRRARPAAAGWPAAAYAASAGAAPVATAVGARGGGA
jgi:putative oxidoreductase